MSQDKEREAWKVGNEFAPYHPDASHVDPQYRDGWNACYRAALASQQAVQGEPVAWRDVVGFEDAYEVSSKGDIRNKRTQNLLSKNLAGSGYIKADLWINGKRKQTTAHRVVAEAFLGPSQGREVNHKNGDKRDNRVENLEWCSHAENVNHQYYVLDSRIRPVKATNVDTGEVRLFPSVCKAVESGFNSGHVHSCLAGKRSIHKRHSFEYASPPSREPQWQPIEKESK